MYWRKRHLRSKNEEIQTVLGFGLWVRTSKESLAVQRLEKSDKIRKLVYEILNSKMISYILTRCLLVGEVRENVG